MCGIFIAISLCQVVGEEHLGQVVQCGSFVVKSEGVAMDEMAGGHCIPFSALQAGCDVSGVIYRLREGMLLMLVRVILRR